MPYEVVDCLVKLDNKVDGSINEKNARDFLHKKFSEIINDIKIQSYDFLGWFLKEKNKMEILSPYKKRDINLWTEFYIYYVNRLLQDFK